MHTEDEAKTMWCSCARVPPDEILVDINDPRRGIGPAVNRLPGDLSLCLASYCMHWRWNVTHEDAARYNAQVAGNKRVANGYCGLSGKP